MRIEPTTPDQGGSSSGNQIQASDGAGGDDEAVPPHLRHHAQQRDLLGPHRLSADLGAPPPPPWLYENGPEATKRTAAMAIREVARLYAA